MLTIAKIICRHDPERPALTIGDSVFSYGQLASCAAGITVTLLKSAGTRKAPVLIWADKTFGAYASIVGTHGAGLGYVPLSPKAPSQRLVEIVRQSGGNLLVVSSVSASLLEFLKAVERLQIVSDRSVCDELSQANVHHDYIPLSNGDGLVSEDVEPSSLAYLLFTSGSTGTPKGVPISFGNLGAYLTNVKRLFPLAVGDRCSQVFDLTFDLSVHDIFHTLQSGAWLFAIGQERLSPTQFIIKHQLTHWFSVPSLANQMMRMRTLRPGALPSLKCSLFCGEPLPTSTADAWRRAAPNSAIHNLYGPTEATIAITSYDWLREANEKPDNRDVVPIGSAFDDQICYVQGADGQTTSEGLAKGELLLTGTQVAAGYLSNAERTTERFIRIEGSGEPAYRTGDLVERDEEGILHHLGRLDDQVKIRGNRVELGEIESVLRGAAGAAFAIAVPVPSKENVESIVGVIETSTIDSIEILRRCKERLPDYMVPKRIHELTDVPYNANGKIDRAAIGKAVSSK